MIAINTTRSAVTLRTPSRRELDFRANLANYGHADDRGAVNFPLIGGKRAHRVHLKERFTGWAGPKDALRSGGRVERFNLFDVLEPVRHDRTSEAFTPLNVE